MARLGTGEDETWVSQLLEDPAGDLWMVGGTKALGPKYIDGWIAKLAGSTGALELGGVRAFGPSEGSFEAAVLTPGGLFVAGWIYDPVSSQQPVMGELALDGSWSSVLRPGTSLLTAAEGEQFTDVAQAADGGMVLVGFTTLGQGSCATCDGTDALAIKLKADRTIEWTRLLGAAYGDDSIHRVVALPGGDFILLGGGRGKFDYSLGAGTDRDSSPSLVYRIDSTGNYVWQRELRLPDERGAGIRDAVLDPATGELVISGFMRFGGVPFIARMTTDGVITRVREVVLADVDGEVSSVVLADDGGLFIAGYELEPPLEVVRHVYVARVDPSWDRVEWALQTTSGYSQEPLRMIRSQRGDLVVAMPGGGSTGTDSLIARIDVDGQKAACWSTSPATLTLRSVGDSSVATTYLQTTIANPVLEVRAGIALDLPTSPAPAMRCSP